MITGIGTDIVRIERIKKSVERHPEHFIRHIFTAEEQLEASGRSQPWQYYAGRWTVKEALSKALGCGIGKNCAWLDICTLNNASGRPEVSISGKAAESAAKEGIKKIHVSISHEAEYACATVIMEA
jgi:holo-[acyl-carrier protein] synthase